MTPHQSTEASIKSLFVFLFIVLIALAANAQDRGTEDPDNYPHRPPSTMRLMSSTQHGDTLIQKWDSIGENHYVEGLGYYAFPYKITEVFKVTKYSIQLLSRKTELANVIKRRKVNKIVL